ncbi:MAG TPA: glycosyltransferase family 4 protein [Pyrinomonadaceae bacterium]|nr:glycosyltransferase family 4 protein [Pyrinomonadaceae bacterium]
MLIDLLIVGLVFSVSLWLTSRLSSPAARLRLLDHPNERSLHATPIPRTGGLAILISLTAGLLLELSRALLAGSRGTFQSGEGGWILLMLLLIAAVSLWDDWTELPVGLRLVVHAVAAAGVVVGAGLTIDVIEVPRLSVLALGWLAVPLTILWLMWMTNLYNFMDGMDGFAGGMTVLGFGFLGYLAWAGGDAFVAVLSLMTVGATAGFLIYNRPPARIFMGDAGSTLLGFLAGTLSVLEIHRGLFDFWVPLLIFSPFVVDATTTLFRRLFRGEKIWQAHRQHYYQRLVLLGWSHQKTVLAEYCLMLACGSSAVLYTRVGANERLALLAGWLLIYLSLAFCVNRAERRNRAEQQSLSV